MAREDEMIAAIVNAMRDIDLTAMSAWNDLDALSTHTTVDEVEVDPNGVVLNSDGTFVGVANLYVTLQYGKGSEEGFLSSESFLGEFTGRLNEGEAVVDDVTVDTSSFYGDETDSLNVA